MIFSGAMPLYFVPGVGDIPQANAVIVTSPTYEGNVLDIQAIADIVHSWGGILIVDEAHGVHFPFHEIFPQGALTQGADIVVHSFHKTLPAFSQSAALHIKGGGVDIKRLRMTLSCVQTSSPSYLIMAATDYMLNMLIDQKSHFESYVENLLSLRKELAPYLIPSDDIGKLGLAVKADSIQGLAFEIQRENYLLAMTSVADTKEGFDRLAKALKGAKATNLDKVQDITLPEVVLSPRQASAKKTCKMPLKDSIGQISAEFIAPFPPGIPILAPGERICESIFKLPNCDYDDCEIEAILL